MAPRATHLCLTESKEGEIVQAPKGVWADKSPRVCLGAIFSEAAVFLKNKKALQCVGLQSEKLSFLHGTWGWGDMRGTIHLPLSGLAL